MIMGLILHNFESHPHTVVDFSEGINVIVGESNAGKTSLARAVRWVWNNTGRGNKSAGNSFASHWITELDKNGNIIIAKDTCYATIILSENKYVTREKNHNGFNGYHIGDYIDGEFHRVESFGKVNTSVPFPILDLLNMEDVNFQNQHDSMFLLSDTGQDCARFFNRLIHLEKADTALAISESRKRAAKKLVVETEEEIQETQEAIDKLDWVESAEMQIEKINLTSEKVEKLSDDIYDLDQMIDNIISAEAKCELPEYHEKAEMIIARIDGIGTKIDSLDDKIYNITVLQHDIRELTIKVRDSGWIVDAKIFSKRIDEMNHNISKKTSDIIQLDETIESIENCNAAMKASDYSKPARIVIEKIDDLDEKIISRMDKIDEIDLMISKIRMCETKIHTGEGSAAKLKRQLPKTCPLCGNKLKETA